MLRRQMTDDARGERIVSQIWICWMQEANNGGCRWFRSRSSVTGPASYWLERVFLALESTVPNRNSPCAILNSCSSAILLSWFRQLTRRQHPSPPDEGCRRGFSSRSCLSVSSAREGCAALNGPHSPRTLATSKSPCSWIEPDVDCRLAVILPT